MAMARRPAKYIWRRRGHGSTAGKNTGNQPLVISEIGISNQPLVPSEIGEKSSTGNQPPVISEIGKVQRPRRDGHNQPLVISEIGKAQRPRRDGHNNEFSEVGVRSS